MHSTFVALMGFGGNYFRGEPMGRAEVELRVDKLKNGKVAGKDEIPGEMIKGRGDRVAMYYGL